MKQLVFNSRYLTLIYGMFFYVVPVSAQDSIPTESIFKALQYDDIINVIIETNLDSLINVRRRKKYQPGKFIYEDSSGKKITRSLKIKPRGKFRRKICDFPPIKLNFSKKELRASGLSKYDDYKLITHCLADKKVSKEIVLREYLIYKMYNLFTENSFHVQCLNITYIDSKKKIPKLKRVGFLLEDTGELSNRIGTKVFSVSRLPMDSFNIEQFNFLAVFQYMIGNIDWQASPITKNVKVMKYKDAKTYQLIPYDFDFCGLVNPPYLRVATHLNQKNGQQRIFFGQIDTQDDLKEILLVFESKKEELLNCINSFKLLTKPSRKSIRKYIESFYEDIADGMVEMR